MIGQLGALGRAIGTLGAAILSGIVANSGNTPPPPPANTPTYYFLGF